MTSGTVERVATDAERNTLCWIDEGVGRYKVSLAEIVESGTYTQGDIDRLTVAGRNDLLALSGQRFGGVVRRAKAKVGA